MNGQITDFGDSHHNLEIIFQYLHVQDVIMVWRELFQINFEVVVTVTEIRYYLY